MYKERIAIATDDASDFARRFRDALRRIDQLHECSSENVSDEDLQSFFPKVTAAEADAYVTAWREKSRDDQIRSEIVDRWSLDNLAFRYGETRDQWKLDDVTVSGDGSVEIIIDVIEVDAVMGTIRQIAHYAGGRLVDDDKALSEVDERKSQLWWPFRKR